MATATEDAKAVDFRKTAGDDVHGRALPNLGKSIVHMSEGVHSVAPELGRHARVHKESSNPSCDGPNGTLGMSVRKRRERRSDF